MTSMRRIKITILGTATSLGVPVIGCNCDVCLSDDSKDKRLRSSVLIETNDLKLVIDCGPDFRSQMLQAGVKDVDAILFTHEHRDHTAGLDDIRAFNYLLRKDIPIYGRPSVIAEIKRQFAYIFKEDKYEGAPGVTVNYIKNEPLEIKNTQIIPIEVLHHKLPVFGFRVGDFAYITDASYISDEELTKLKGVKVLVLNALRNTSHFSHFSINEALHVIEEIKPEQAYLTHVSHLIGKHNEVNGTLPSDVALAYDGLSFVLE